MDFNQKTKLRVLGIGAGGHAKVVIEILRFRSDIEITGLVDANPDKVGSHLLGATILGTDADLANLSADIDAVFLGVGTGKDTVVRRRLYSRVEQLQLPLVSAIHPTAIVSESAEIGAGATVGPAAVIHSAAELGANVIVNTRAVVEHDCLVGDHAHIATGAVLAGGVTVGEGALIGAGAVVKPGVSIGRNSVIGAGSVVIRDTPADSTLVGTPAHVLRRTA